MDSSSGDLSSLTKIAVLGITFSLIATIGFSLALSTGGDYSYDEIQSGRNELIAFSGESMLNQSPWKLVGVATPWISTDGVEGHLDPDGWLYGSYYTTSEDYSEIGKTADIAMDPNQISTVPISVNDATVEYTVEDGYKWWAQGWWSVITKPIGEALGNDPIIYAQKDATIWNYTGYRYIFDPMLPFSDGSTSKDGALSMVWYRYNGQEGLAGGLQIYGGDVILSSYSATDIIADYNQTSAYATTYDFAFNGVMLTLSIRFNPDVIESGTPLLQAWTQGAWTMAISSVSAGNFYDLEDSASFSHTAGSMVQTFIQIYTFSIPNVDNVWAKTIMWLMVGLPMTIGMLYVTLRMVTSVTRVFGV